MSQKSNIKRNFSLIFYSHMLFVVLSSVFLEFWSWNYCDSLWQKKKKTRI